MLLLFPDALLIGHGARGLAGGLAAGLALAAGSVLIRTDAGRLDGLNVLHKLDTLRLK